MPYLTIVVHDEEGEAILSTEADSFLQVPRKVEEMKKRYYEIQREKQDE